jgi:ubiquinone/menaquinone biosynthesis C-methylase UbiE
MVAVSTNRPPDPFSTERVRAAYDAVAGEYAATFATELDRLPLDRAFVDRLLTMAADGPLLESGAGVGPVARYVGERRRVVACDLSEAMLRHAPPGARCVQADVRRLPFRSGAFAAATARYVLQHVPRVDVPTVLAELRRLLLPGGVVLVAVHLGEGEVVLDEMLGRRFAPMGGAFHGREEIRRLLAGAGFVVDTERVRAAVGEEFDNPRAYVIARATRR